jgi:hypothetical protein
MPEDRGRDLVTANNRGSIVPHDLPSELDMRELKGSLLRFECASTDLYLNPGTQFSTNDFSLESA